MSDRIIVLDYGSQYSQLITRRVRELHVFCELKGWNASREALLTPQTKGIILSGGPNSIYAPNAPYIQDFLLESGLPILGICYGMQALTYTLGGKVATSNCHEYGLAQIRVDQENALLPIGEHNVWMSHGDRIESLPEGFKVIGSTPNSPYAAMANEQKRYYGLQYHPEVYHSQHGSEVFERFVLEVCGCQPNWTPSSIIHDSIEAIRAQVGDKPVLSAVSGGVDSSVATALVQKALGKNVYAFFVDTGLLRLNERQQVEAAFRPILGDRLHTIDAGERFLGNLKGITDPETKRRIVGETFIREFEAAAKGFGKMHYLVQGTIYPDVVESQGLGTGHGQKIKTHHNVGGLPEEMNFELVEPLRMLFKDEVREVGEALGLPHQLVWRQPFPGPGLAVRVIGEVTRERVATLQEADAIFTEELGKAGLLQLVEGEDGSLSGTSQAFAVLLPVRSVGVMGDQRTYAETISLRAITTYDFMTADWARLPYDLLAHVSNRIVNEVPGVNRVLFDVSSKPPATIEWE
jgi:GMP synthase (glutamine-hydrolysing)